MRKPFVTFHHPFPSLPAFFIFAAQMAKGNFSGEKRLEDLIGLVKKP
jgi:hypothetical protein